MIAILGIVAIGGAVIGITQAVKAFQGTPKVVVEGNYIEAVGSEPTDEIGSVSSPIINSRWLQINGIRYWYVDVNMEETSTTTLCRFVNPAAATSTIVSLDFTVLTGTSSAVRFDMATSTAASSYATTSAIIHDANLSAYTGGHFSSNLPDAFGGPGQTGRLLPTEYVVLKGVTSSYSTGVRLTGYCHAVFREL